MMQISLVISMIRAYVQVKNETWALWTWYRNQDSEDNVGDQIYIVREPDRCHVQQVVDSWPADL